MRHKKRNLQHDILFLLISSFIVVAAWIGFNLWHIHVTSTISEHVQEQLTPIDPTFNRQTIQELMTREVINPIYVQQNASGSAIPTPAEPSAAPNQLTSTPSVTPNPSGSVQSAPTTGPIERLGQ